MPASLIFPGGAHPPARRGGQTTRPRMARVAGLRCIERRRLFSSSRRAGPRTQRRSEPARRSRFLFFAILSETFVFGSGAAGLGEMSHRPIKVLLCFFFIHRMRGTKPQYAVAIERINLVSADAADGYSVVLPDNLGSWNSLATLFFFQFPLPPVNIAGMR